VLHVAPLVFGVDLVSAERETSSSAPLKTPFLCFLVCLLVGWLVGWLFGTPHFCCEDGGSTFSFPKLSQYPHRSPYGVTT
jgi:hypothetical protein